jgi:pantoate--beta-alanine ligase
MYPEGFQTQVEVERTTRPLCGAVRPGHFRGVTTVVTKLFHLVRPHVAVFGEKDWQQLVTVRRMVADLDFGIEVIGVPTVRDADGLALSSRNERLGAVERAAAACVPQALRAVAELAAAGERSGAALLGAVRGVLAAEPRVRIEYAELRDPETLEEVAAVDGRALVAVAVWIGDVRLIDNCVVEASNSASRRAEPGGPDGAGATSAAPQAAAATGEPT